MKTDINITLKRYILPYGTINVFINGDNYSLKPGQKLKLNLPKKGEYNIAISSFIHQKEKKVFLTDGSTLNIKHLLPMSYYLFGVFIGLILFVLGTVDIVPVFYVTTFVLIFYLPIIYYNFINRKKFFEIQIF
ncbi:hypothetical protein [Psychroflexus tropicus]|uniref:hypothetical protein n=1 Tax=Psychroflexus tropicus TaxID=197345 RepID=UPI000373D66A|nr:hypothetical protein [Psychroflexus tropicus]